MISKPERCCPVGSTEHQVPMAVSGKRVDVDFCIADIVAALNAAGIYTAMSCCGHGEKQGWVTLRDGRLLNVNYPQKTHDQYTVCKTISSEELARQGYWKCNSCGVIRDREEELWCWRCGRGQMIYHKILEKTNE